MSQPQVRQVVTTTDSEAEASRLAKGLVENRLAACVQVDGPIKSTYWWEGSATTDEEWRLTMKTAAERYEALENWLVANHTYDVPEILATEVLAGHQPYLQWAVDETRSTRA